MSLHGIARMGPYLASVREAQAAMACDITKQAFRSEVISVESEKPLAGSLSENMLSRVQEICNVRLCLFSSCPTSILPFGRV